MAWQKFPLSLTLLCTALCLELATVPSLRAQTSQTITTEVWASFTLPPGRGIPDNRSGGATRTLGCLGDEASENKPFLSLIPEYREINSRQPSFEVYIPHTVANKVFFSLRDANEDYSYEAELPLPKTSGMYRLQLPDDAPEIAPNKKYKWSLSLICGRAVDPNDPRIGGVIELNGLDTKLSSQSQNSSSN